MTTDDTQVDVDELDKLASALLGNSDKIQSVADQASGIDYNVNTFGLFGAILSTCARGTAQQTVAGVRSLAINVTADAEVVAQTATDMRNNEDTQANRFRGETPHG